LARWDSLACQSLPSVAVRVPMASSRSVLTAVLLPLCSVTTSIALEGPRVDAVQVDPESGFLRDSQGRARIFHGVNVVFKETPWYPPSGNFTPDDSLDAQTMDLLRKWGFNVVRLGVMWPGVEPRRGDIDIRYLAEVSRLSSELAKRGVYTLVDLHQDVGSRRFCGEGFPEFYIDELAADPNSSFSQAAAFPLPQSYKMPLDASGLPPLQECLRHQFADYYLTDQVGAMWGELYRPGSSLNEGFSRYWAAVAKTFAGASHILGYELLNEPSGVCLETGALSCLDSVKTIGNSVEAEKLTPLYRAAAKSIRAVDPRTPIFYEPTVVPKLSDAFPEPALEDEQQGLAYHIYCQAGDGDSIVAAAVCLVAQDLFADLYYGFLHKHKGIAGFMTEFGAIGGSPTELKHLHRLLAFADGEFQSWAYWMLKRYHDFTTANAAESLYDEHGNLEVAKLKALSRTYAPAIAGTPQKMAFNPDTGSFTLEFVATVSEAPTEVYLNEELNYPSGYSVEVTPAHCVQQQKKEPNYIDFVLEDSSACKGSVVRIQIDRTSTNSSSNSLLI